MRAVWIIIGGLIVIGIFLFFPGLFNFLVSFVKSIFHHVISFIQSQNTTNITGV